MPVSYTYCINTMPMEPHKTFALTALAISLLAAGCNQTQPLSVQTMPSPTQGSPITTPTDPSQSPRIEESDQGQTPSATPTIRSTASSTAGTYEAYSSAQATAAHKAGKKVVLFFHADWCPFCVEADKQFKARLSELPANTIILKTNYDTEMALKKKYAVTYQHTFVQIDADGNLVSKWNGGDVENLKKYLK